MAKPTVTIPAADLERLVFFDMSAKPMIQRLYAVAGLTIPDKFAWAAEAERLVVALQTQGFNAKFPFSQPNAKEKF